MIIADNFSKISALSTETEICVFGGLYVPENLLLILEFEVYKTWYTSQLSRNMVSITIKVKTFAFMLPDNLRNNFHIN